MIQSRGIRQKSVQIPKARHYCRLEDNIQPNLASAM